MTVLCFHSHSETVVANVKKKNRSAYCMKSYKYVFLLSEFESVKVIKQMSNMTTNNGLYECPDIYPVGHYYQPERFKEREVKYGDGGEVTLRYPI